MQCAVAQNTVEHSRLVKIPRECKGNVHLLSWGGGEMPKFAEAARRVVKFSVLLPLIWSTMVRYSWGSAAAKFSRFLLVGKL